MCGRFHLSINDVLNAVVCRSEEGDHDAAVPNEEQTPFQRFGVTEDGIDLTYDADESTVQISLRYRKLVVTNTSLPSLAGVGVTSASKPGHDAADASAGNGALIHQIIPGMEFIDGGYIMRIHEVRRSAIHAKRWYKIVDSAGRTARVNALEVMVYRDVEAVHNMIQARDA